MTKTKSSQQVVTRARRERVSWRLRMLSRPRQIYVDRTVLPEILPSGVRKSAVRAECSDRILDMSFPFLWRLGVLKKQYRHRFDERRLQQIDALMDAGNATMYTKLANSTIDTKKPEAKRSKAWTESEWKKHMDYISPLAEPKPLHLPKKPKKKKWKPLPQLLPRAAQLAILPEFKKYKRLSQEDWYRDPIKVSEHAMKYVTSERMKVLAKPKEIPTEYK